MEPLTLTLTLTHGTSITSRRMDHRESMHQAHPEIESSVELEALLDSAFEKLGESERAPYVAKAEVCCCARMHMGMHIARAEHVQTEVGLQTCAHTHTFA